MSCLHVNSWLRNHIYKFASLSRDTGNGISRSWISTTKISIICRRGSLKLGQVRKTATHVADNGLVIIT
jgi:hypothetical protein